MLRSFQMTLVGGSMLWHMCLHSFRSPCNFFLRQNGTFLTELVEIVRKPYSHRVIFTTSAQKSYNAHAMSLRVPYDYLKSLRSVLGPKWLSKIVQPPHDQPAVPLQVSCDLPAMCLQATILRFFKTFHSAELNKFVEATMPMNPYDDHKVSLR